MTQIGPPSTHELWARFRFSVIGRLLSDPPNKGELKPRIESLAKKAWRHPISDSQVYFAAPTIERWYYLARNDDQNPLAALQRKRRNDSGTPISLSDPLRQAILAQYKDHPGWSYRLHYDNLFALADVHEELKELPSYATVRRFMKQKNLLRHQRRSKKGERASKRFSNRETRSYESAYVNGLWHLDFHHGSRRLIGPDGDWTKPLLLGILDDHSRLCCHVQWYFEESARALIHGLSQAFQKRGLPRALLTDNGAAMEAGETKEGFAGLSILYEQTLPYSPEQNGKQERFWVQIEGRLLPMLEGVEDLDINSLNEATQAWAELDYNRKFHSEIRATPLDRFLNGPQVGRVCSTSEALGFAFTVCQKRRVRRSDGTVSVLGKRFEIPNRYRQLSEVWLRFSRWDMTRITMVDSGKRTALCRLYPLDKERNSNARRRTLEALGDDQILRPLETKASGPAPLLHKLLQEYAATGFPSAYLPMTEFEAEEREEQE